MVVRSNTHGPVAVASGGGCSGGEGGEVGGEGGEGGVGGVGGRGSHLLPDAVVRVVDLRPVVVRDARHDELRAGFLEEVLVSGSEGGGGEGRNNP